MIHKPIEGKHPNGMNALDVLQSHLRHTRIRHLRAGEQKIEGDCFMDDRGRVPVRIDERPSFVYSLMY